MLCPATADRRLQQTRRPAGCLQPPAAPSCASLLHPILRILSALPAVDYWSHPIFDRVESSSLHPKHGAPTP